MSYLYFDALDIKSFKSYREPARIPFERMGLGLWFVKGDNQLHVRLGSNGVGKSTIWDCLSWVLYGRSVGGHRTPDLIGWGGKVAPEASVTISAGKTKADLDRFVISRKGVSNGLSLDGKVVSQETIDALIGLSYENFLHTVILGQGKPLFFDLGATKKMEVLSETLNLGKWDERIARARKETNVLISLIVQTDADLRAFDRSIEKLEETQQNLKAASRVWESERADADERKRRAIQDLEKSLKQYQQDLDDADLNYDAAETELRHSQASLDQAQADNRMHIEALAKARSELNAATQAENDLIIKREKHQDGDNCSYCGSRLDAKAMRRHFDNILDELDDAKVRTEKARRRLEDAQAADAEALKREKGHADDLRKYRNKSNDAIDARTRAQGNVNRLKAEIDAAKKARVETEEKVNPYDAMLADARRDIREAKADAADLEKKLKKLEAKKVRTNYWTEGFKLVRLQLIDEVLAELEGVTQTLLSSVGLDEWRVRYDIDKENKSGTVTAGLNVSIYQPEYDQAVKWELFSGGEAQRLRVIGAVALSEVLLRRAGVNCELLVFDEPTRHLSPEGVRDTVDFLTERAKDQLVVYCDHAAIDTNRMAGVLRVTKDRHGTRLTVS